MVSQILLDIVAIALAINQVCDTWFNGSIFAVPRAYLEAWQSIEDPTGLDRVRLFFADLLLCPFCLSHHVMILMILAFWLPSFLPTGGVITMLPVYGVAALRLSFIIKSINPYDD